MRALIDDGPFQPDDALRHGLVDDLAYEDELDDLVRSRPSRRADCSRATTTRTSPGNRPASAAQQVAVINAAGVINSGRGGFDPVNGAVLGSDSLVEVHPRSRADASIRAIVLRIDSPGGSSTASDVIWRELMITKRDPHKRPIIVSMSDLAASGGYYIAMAGDVIVAQPGTLTGSIGVYTGKFVTGGTLDKLGANIDATSTGRHAEIYSPDRRFTPDERTRCRSRCRPLRSVRRAGRRGAPHVAGEDRSDCAGPRVDGAAGAAGRPGRRARRSAACGEHRQAARAHSRGRRSGARLVSAAPQPL